MYGFFGRGYGAPHASIELWCTFGAAARAELSALRKSLELAIGRSCWATNDTHKGTKGLNSLVIHGVNVYRPTFLFDRLLEGKEFVMGKDCNKLTSKMRRKNRQVKLKARIKRRAEAVRKERAAR